MTHLLHKVISITWPSEEEKNRQPGEKKKEKKEEEEKRLNELSRPQNRAREQSPSHRSSARGPDELTQPSLT